MKNIYTDTLWDWCVPCPATSESIMKVMTYLRTYYGKDIYATTIHICGANAFVEI